MLSIPYQFVSKGYTEVLGRVPSPSELVQFHNAFIPQGCTYNSVNNAVDAFLLSPEFQSLNLTNRERVQTVYRLMLNRDPDAGGWNYFAGLPLTQTINAIKQSSEYKQYVLALCTGKAVRFGIVPIDAAISDAGLRQQLATATPGQTITVSGRIAVSAPLTIPNGVTLQGKPGHYATSATLLRQSAFYGPVVNVTANATLRHLTVDGRRTDIGYSQDSPNIEVIGSGATVANVRSQNPTGWTMLFCSPHYGVVSNVTIERNTMIGYGTSRDAVNGKAAWADGLSIACDGANINGNDIIDATDVGLISFDPYSRGTHHQYFGNYVLNTVNTWAMIGIDQQQGYKSFANTAFIGNLLFTAGNAKARIAVINGASPWADNRSTMGTAQYVGNYGYVRYELYGVNNDSPTPMFLPDVGLVPTGAKINPPCVGAKYPATGTTYNCLMSVAK